MENRNSAHKFLEAYIKVNLISVLLALISKNFTGLLGALTVFLISVHVLPVLVYYSGLNRFNTLKMTSELLWLLASRNNSERRRF